MKKYKVYRSESFQKEVSKYDKVFQDRIDKIEDKLMINSEYGSPLGMKSFRETRFEGYRVYYLIYEDLGAIYMVAISDKKDQQKTINTIRLFLEFFREEAEQLIREDKNS
jgi:mRNA-degrading endonuclease RelE of RelBE toxin-antitoxin system